MSVVVIKAKPRKATSTYGKGQELVLQQEGIEMSGMDVILLGALPVHEVAFRRYYIT